MNIVNLTYGTALVHVVCCARCITLQHVQQKYKHKEFYLWDNPRTYDVLGVDCAPSFLPQNSSNLLQQNVATFLGTPKSFRLHFDPNIPPLMKMRIIYQIFLFFPALACTQNSLKVRLSTSRFLEWQNTMPFIKPITPTKKAKGNLNNSEFILQAGVYVCIL